MTLRPRLLLIALALLFFTGPLLVLAGGARPRMFENRAPAPRPSPSMGFGAFDVARRYLTEHLPFREDAVKANTRLAQDVFGYTPEYGGAGGDTALPFGGVGADAGAPPRRGPPEPKRTIFQGRRGWYFLQDDLNRACNPPVPEAAGIAAWRRLVDVLAAKGRPTRVVVAPDKSAIYPELLPDGDPQGACHAEGVAALRAGLREAGPAFRPVLLDTLDAAKRARAPLTVYSPNDSHWNGLGAVAAVDALVGAVDPAVRVRPGDVRVRPREPYLGDLPQLLATPKAGFTPGAVVVRAGTGRAETTDVRTPHAVAHRTRRTGATAPMLEGRTLLIHDSFGVPLRPLLTPYVRDLTTVAFDDLRPGDLTPLITAADRVIVETAERAFLTRAGPAGNVPPAEVDHIARDVPPRG